MQTCSEGSFVGIACPEQEEITDSASAEYKTSCFLDMHECNPGTAFSYGLTAGPTRAAGASRGVQGRGFSICNPSAVLLAWPLLCTHLINAPHTQHAVRMCSLLHDMHGLRCGWRSALE